MEGAGVHPSWFALILVDLPMLLEVFVVVFPIFALVGVGYSAARIGYLDRSYGDILSRFVVQLLIPLMLFRSLGTADLSGLTPWKYWAAYYSAMAIMAILGGFLVRTVFKREARAAVIGGLTSAYSNTALVGLPLVDSIYGMEGTVLVSLLIVLHSPLTALTASIMMERAVVVDGVKAPKSKIVLFKSVGLSMIRNPILFGVLCGLLWNATGVRLPVLVERIINPMANSASPVALIAVGVSMVNYGVRGNLGIGSVLAIFKSFLMPLLVFVMTGYVFGLPPLWVAVATLASACPTGVFSFIMANQFGTGHAMSTNAITITTAISVFSVSFWLWFIQVQGY